MHALTAPLRELPRRIVSEEGSTRALALMRIGLVLLLWARWGTEMALFRAHDWPSLGIALLFWGSSLATVVGCATRVSASLLAVAVGGVVLYVDLALRQEAHHHTALLFIASLLLAMSPCGRSLSLDRWFALRRAASAGTPAPEERGPLWAQRLIALQVSSVYFWSAVDKSTWSWVSGQRLQMILMEQYTDFAWPEVWWFEPLTALGGTGSLLLEYALAVGLWSPGARRVLVPLGLLFHGFIFLTLPVSTFSLTMTLLYLSFLEPATVHRFIDTLLGAGPTRDSVTPSP